MYVMLVVLAMLLSGTTVYFIMKDKPIDIKQSNEENDVKSDEEKNDKGDEKSEKDIQLKSGIVLNRREKVGDKFIEDYSIEMNGKTRTLTIEFSQDYDNNENQIIGKIGNDILFTKRNINGDSDFLKKESIIGLVDAKNLFIIRSTDGKDFLGVASNIDYREDDMASYQYLMIYDENFELIDGINPSDNSDDVRLDSLENNINTKGVNPFLITTGSLPNIMVENNPWYNNTFNTCKNQTNCKIKVKIENDKIYYLTSIDFFDKLENRVYSITNGRLEYNVLTSYEIKNFENLPF